ncbi:unnamed protein product [Dracunculus medinensis]|uniref:F-box domain-containing protein n=1 Tax=Dracunculus medinensis TaxID=318479 RepID=A0A0N4U1B6_DRAME|nr:unnamed protein product [Dracunculus medinensis]
MSSPSKKGQYKLPDCERLLRQDDMRRQGHLLSGLNFLRSISPKEVAEYNLDTGEVTQFRIDSPLSQNGEDDDFNHTDDDLTTKEDLMKWIDQFKIMSASMQLKALSLLVDECSLPHIKHLNSIIEPFFQKDFIRDLPSEVALHILNFLTPTDLVNVSRVCRYWHRLAEDNQLWRKKCHELGIDIMDPPRLLLKHNCYQTLFHCRSKWKAMYLRHMRIQANWRSLPLTGSCILKGHDDHVITCLQIRGDIIVTGSDDNSLKVWSASKAKCLHTLVGHTGGVWSSQMSECGKIIISGSTDRTIRIWSTETGQCLHNLQGHTSTVRCMSLKGEMLVSGSRDTTIRLWNINSGECINILRGHVAAVRCVQFDGIRIVSGAYDYSIKVWNAFDGHCVHTLAGHTNRVYSLLFDSDRDVVVSGSLDTTIRVWNVRLGICLHTLIGHQSLTSGMQLRGNILVSGNADSTIKVWDITDGQCKYTLCGPNRHASAVTSLQFLENGLVATSGDDGSVKLWDVKQGIFIRDLVRLRSGGSGGCIWRLKSTPTMLVCAVGSRNGTEDTKLIMLNFDSDYP